MKPFIGIDITENKYNEEFNGKEFVVQSTTPALVEAYNKATDDIGEFHKKIAMPLPLKIGYYLLGLVAIIFTSGIAKAITRNEDLTFIDAYNNAPWLFWTGIIAWALFGVITLVFRKKMQKMEKSDEYNHAQAKTESLSNTIYAELGVPPQAPFVDVLSFQYKIKNGEIKPKGKQTKLVPFVNIAFKIHSDGKKIYLTEIENKYGFDISELRRIRVIKERGEVQTWNKDVSFDEGVYKQFKITSNDHGIYFKKYCILELEHQGELWQIYFPNYELPIFEQLTGLKAE